MYPILTSEERAVLRKVAIHIAKACDPPPESPTDSFYRLSSLLPSDACWGQPVTPDLVAHILSNAQPFTREELARAVAASVPFAPAFAPTFPDEDVKAFVWGALWRDSPRATSAYCTAVAQTVIDHLRGGPEPATATAASLARRAAAIFLNR